MRDTTKLSCLCRVRFGGVNWILGNSKLSPTENLKSELVQSNRPIQAVIPDTTQTGPSCLSVGRVNWALRGRKYRTVQLAEANTTELFLTLRQRACDRES